MNLIEERYCQIHEQGIDDLFSGNWKEEIIVPDNKILVALTFSINSFDRVAEKLKESPLPMSKAGENYSPHSTLAVAFGELSPGAEKKIKDYRRVEELLTKTLIFNNVLISGGNVLFAVSPIPEEITRIRGFIDYMFFSELLIPTQPFQPYEGILHSTVARITKKGKTSDYSKHWKIVSNLGAEIRKDPLEVAIRGIFVGKVKDLLKN